MKKINIIIPLIIVLVIIIGIFSWQNEKQDRAIKVDACLSGCTLDGFSAMRDNRNSCIADCREKYIISSEEYDEWETKNKKDNPQKSLDDNSRKSLEDIFNKK